jgi:hypothetical protein
MSEQIHIECRLVTRGTAKAKADAIVDRGVDDPAPEVAMAAIREGDGDGEVMRPDEEAALGRSSADHRGDR